MKPGNFLALLFAPAVTALSAIGGSFDAPIGLQLYSLRDDFAKDVPGTLAKVKELGITEVELAGTYGKSPEEFRGALEKAGLRAASGIFPFDRFEKEPEAVAREAKALGLNYAGCAWIPHEGEFGEEAARKAIEVFNKAGAVLKKEGIQFFYHIHGYEFRPHGDGTLFDVIMKETDENNVAYELDTLWAVLPGQNPVTLLEHYPKRWHLMHLKDLRKGVKTGVHTGKTELKNDVALGTGQMDWPAILKAAKEAGVKHYYIEDESPAVSEQLPVSIRFLKEVSW